MAAVMGYNWSLPCDKRVEMVSRACARCDVYPLLYLTRPAVVWGQIGNRDGLQLTLRGLGMQMLGGVGFRKCWGTFRGKMRKRDWVSGPVDAAGWGVDCSGGCIMRGKMRKPQYSK